MEEYEVDLGDYLRVLWWGKWIILVVFLVAVGISLFYSFRVASPVYQTETTLMITPSLSEEIAGGAAGAQVLSPTVYRDLATANDLLEEVGKAVYETERIATESLEKMLSVSIGEEEGANFPLLKMRVTGEDPQEIAQVANIWADKFIRRNSEFLRSSVSQSYDFIATSFDEVSANLEKLEKEKKTYQQEHPRQVIEADLAAMSNKYSSAIALLVDARQELGEAKAQLGVVEAELAMVPEFITIHRGMEAETMWEFLLAGVTQEQVERLPGLIVEEEQKNDNYYSLAGLASQLRVDIASLQNRVNSLESITGEYPKKIEAKAGQLAEIDQRVNAYDREIQALETMYQDLANRKQQALIARGEEPDPIKVVETAVVPQVSIGPHRKMNVAVAGVLGIFVGVLLAFFAHYIHAGRGKSAE
jgi:uncharacterized protein involved in exopolysaccharide biosynthesis